MGAVENLVRLVAGASRADYERDVSTFGAEVKQAKDAFATDASAGAWRRYINAQERLDQANMLLAAAVQKEAEAEAKARAEERAKKEKRVADLRKRTETEYLAREAGSLKDQLNELVAVRYFDVCQGFDDLVVAQRARVAELNALEAELGLPPTSGHMVETIEHRVRGEVFDATGDVMRTKHRDAKPWIHESVRALRFVIRTGQS